MPASGAVVIIKLLLDLRRTLSDHFGRSNDHRPFRAVYLSPALCCNFLQVFFERDFIQALCQALPSCLAYIVHADRSHRLDSGVDLCGRQRESAAPADTDDADSVAIDLRVPSEVVHAGAEILDEGLRGGDEVRLASALPVVRGIESQRNETALRHRLSVEARRLFLHPAERMPDDDRRVSARALHVLGEVQVGDQVDAGPVIVGHFLVVDLAALLEGLVPCQGGRR
ncbi:hypothetical protein D3C87_1431740 [compost metagenome]